MKSLVRNGIAVGGLSTALALASSAFAVALRSSLDFGMPAAGVFIDCVVTITPDMTSIGIYRIQNVRFIDASTGQSFVWHFDTKATGFDLSKVAPAGIPAAAHVRTYVLGYDWQSTGLNACRLKKVSSIRRRLFYAYPIATGPGHERT